MSYVSDGFTEETSTPIFNSVSANYTLRPCVPAFEQKHFGVIHKVLDHGHVRLIDYLGDDDAIVQSARVSYGRGTKSQSDTETLIRYLVRHRHSSPLEHCAIKFHIKLPIFVARQFIRHRTASVNEVSARYSILSKEFYVPDIEQIAVQSKNNKQGRGESLTQEQAREVQGLLIHDADKCYDTYAVLLNDSETGLPVDHNRPGIARELARMNLTLNTYTEWYWMVNLHNLFHFLKLRKDPHAQYEIRVYADKMAEMVSDWVPAAYRAFSDYHLNSQTLSSSMLKVISDALGAGKIQTRENYNLTSREWNDLLHVFPALENFS